MQQGTLEQQDRFRKLACLCAILATPGFVLCGIEHFCMDGHMAHPPYPQWAKCSDAAYILLIGAGAVFSARSNTQSRGWMTATLLLMLFPRFLMSAGGLDFIAIPPLWFFAIRGLLRRDPDSIDPGLCRHCGYDLTGNTSGICPECGYSITELSPPN